MLTINVRYACDKLTINRLKVEVVKTNVFTIYLLFCVQYAYDIRTIYVR